MNVLSRMGKWLLDENERRLLAPLCRAPVAVNVGRSALFEYSRRRNDVAQNIDASNRSMRFNDAGAAQYVEQIKGGTLAIDSGPNAEQIRMLIEPLLADSRDQAVQVAQLLVTPDSVQQSRNHVR